MPDTLTSSLLHTCPFHNTQVRAHLVHGKGAIEMPRELLPPKPVKATVDASSDDAAAAADKKPDDDDAAAAAAAAPDLHEEEAANAAAAAAARAVAAGAAAAAAQDEQGGAEAIMARLDQMARVRRAAEEQRHAPPAAPLTQAQRIQMAEAAMRASYSESESNRAFKHIVDFHDKQGWVSHASLES